MVVDAEREGEGEEERERDRHVHEFVGVCSYPGSQVREAFQEVGMNSYSIVR